VKKKQKSVVKPRRVAKPTRVAKYIHRTDKWIALHAKLREARLREEGLVRAKKADFMHKALPTYTAEHPSKYVVEQESDTHLEVPAAVTPKRESREDDDEDAETIDLR
jgi:isoaspartyl peptidase/L-asparaginase-like protein (Ntn-hydrolase superfamily)